MSNSLTDLLKKGGASQTAPLSSPNEPNPEEVLQFKTNPLAVIMLHTELQSTIVEKNYSDVFEA